MYPKTTNSLYNKIIPEEDLTQDKNQRYTFTHSHVEQQRLRRRWCCKVCILVTTVILTLILLTFFGVFVLIPLVFKHSVQMQRNLIFRRCNTEHEFLNFQRHGIEGARTIYIPIHDSPEIHLGTWHILHLAYAYNAVENSTFDYQNALRDCTRPVVIYFHGGFGNRIAYVKTYHILRRFFHVIAFDYRSYGDSTAADLTEEMVVQDSVQLYKWLHSQTKAPIYVWGYSLGASIASQTVAMLRTENIIPMGLFLESPFTSIREELLHFPHTKFFSWLPWFEATIIAPLEANGFVFNTTQYMQSVDCPIMMIHANDDLINPISLTKKLFHSAEVNRNRTVQGNVTFLQLPEIFGCGHTKIYEALILPDYIKMHIKVCEEFENRKAKN